MMELRCGEIRVGSETTCLKEFEDKICRQFLACDERGELKTSKLTSPAMSEKSFGFTAFRYLSRDRRNLFKEELEACKAE